MRKDIHILDNEVIFLMLKNFPGWSFKEDKISKEFVFLDFVSSIQFVLGLTPIFEKNDHHPDIHIYYNKIVFELQRFDVGGKVTDMDFKIASEIDNAYSYYNSLKN